MLEMKDVSTEDAIDVESVVADDESAIEAERARF